MSDSSAYQVVEAVRNRLAGIDLDSGYNTDMGARLYLGKRQANEADLYEGPQLQLFITDDAPAEGDNAGDMDGNAQIELGITVVGTQLTGADNPLKIACDLIQDIKSAVLVSTDRTLSGLSLDVGYSGTDIEYPESGVDIVQVSVNFTALYSEVYGTP